MTPRPKKGGGGARACQTAISCSKTLSFSPGGTFQRLRPYVRARVFMLTWTNIGWHRRYGHGMMSTAMHDQIVSTCNGNYIKPSDACQALIDKASDMLVDTNGYDIYRTCYHPPSAPSPSSAIAEGQAGAEQIKHRWPLAKMMEAYREGHSGRRDAVRQWLRESVPCINSVKGTAYLNMPEVRAALHVEESPNTWAICGGVNYTDDGVYTSMIAVHKQLQQYKPNVLVYNGDADPGCNYLWAEASVAKFGLDVEAPWKPWVYGADSNVGEQLGGYLTTYFGNVLFATVHGAGHMSPQWRPEAVFTLVSKFLHGAPI